VLLAGHRIAASRDGPNRLSVDTATRRDTP
jgi:hypothetical protein